MKRFLQLFIALAFAVGAYAQNEVHIVQKTRTTVLNLADVKGIAVGDYSVWQWMNTADYNYSVYWGGTVDGVDVYYRKSFVDKTDTQYKFVGMAGGYDLIVNYNPETGNCQVLPQQVTTHSTYGPVFVSDIPHYPLKSGYSYDNYPCTFDENIGQFSLHLIYFVSTELGGSANGQFANGVETIQLAGYYIPDYSFSMSFVNQRINENGEDCAVISTIKGVDITKYLITVVEETASIDDVVNGMINGTHSCYEFTESTEVSFPITSSGKYKAVAVTFDEKGNPYEEKSIDFEFYLNGENSWESLGYATYVDDCIAPMIDSKYYEYKVEVLENKDQPGLFRMVDPYGPQFPLYPYASSYNPGSYIEIDATDPEGVWIEGWQSTGLDVQNNGLMEVTSMAWYQANAQGITKDEAKVAGLCGVYADGVITFPVKGLAVAVGGRAYYGNQSGAFKLDMTNMTETAEAPAVKKIKGKVGRIAAESFAANVETPENGTRKINNVKERNPRFVPVGLKIIKMTEADYNQDAVPGK